MATARALIGHVAVLGVLVGGLIFSAAPALAAPPEAPVTQAASPVVSTSATLHGELNPGASGTAGYYFSYGLGSTCEGATAEPEPGVELTGKGVKVSAPLTGLEGNSKYTFCLVATHFENGAITEATPGNLLSFTTLAAKPTTEGGEPTSVTPFAASAFTFVNPQNETTTCEFQYGIAPAFNKSVPCEPPSLEGQEQLMVSVNFTGLTPASAYDYRVVAKNGTGTTTGAEGTFSTLAAEAPIVEGETISGVSASSAKLEAQINPNYQVTAYKLEYATNAAFTGATTVVGASSPLPEGFGDQPVSFALSGLQPRTTYYLRVVATNGTGPTEGAVQSFTTLATPIVTTGAAQGSTRTAATVSGTVNPGGIATRAHFVYISQAGYEAAGGSSVADPYVGGGFTTGESVGSDYTVHSVGPLELSELAPGTMYHFALVASNAEGTTIGPDMTFTTLPPTPPTAVTGEAAGVTQVSAVLTGSVDTSGLQTVVSFEFGGTPALGSPQIAAVTPKSLSGTTEGISLTFASSLVPGTTYYYRAKASNSDGVSYGTVKSFTTPALPALPTFNTTLTTVLPPAPPLPTAEVATPKKKQTNAQKLAKALKACAKKPKSKRAACQKQARKKYPVKKKKKK
ncbi:MAG TPA: fibronectin type III domain-containing protein [Solirubrobacteraceae bacterium]|jgi:phosphodiesterase/alkaline phosphatase D-like protein